MGDAPDRDVWLYAIEHEAVLVTKDQDFADPRPFGGPAPAVVWVRLGNTSRRSLLAWFQPTIDRVVAIIQAGDRLVELR